jgi:hypothetical protein
MAMTDPLNAAPTNSAGLLTSVMRAASSPGGAKVLRVGLVHRGKVIDERIVAERDHLTIGPNEKATFVFSAPGVPPNHRLFERAGDHYKLNLTRGMTGRIATPAGTADLTAHTGSIPLSAESRGKIVIGEHTVLFQFVAPAPGLGKPQLPMGVKSSLGDVDFRTSVIAAFSFLVHFGAVGSIYSDWMDPVVDDEAETTQIIESMKQLPAPPPVEHPRIEETPSVGPREATKSAPAQGAARTAGAGTGGSRAAGDARAHQISSQLAALEMQLLVGLNSNGGPATSAVLGPGTDLPLGMLDKAAASSDGVRMGSAAGLDLGGGHGPLRPGVLPRGPVPGDPASLSPMTAGSAVRVAPPPGNVSVPPPNVTGGIVPNAPGIVAGMAAGFRRCYNNELSRGDPSSRGTVRITAKIGPNGEVLATSASSSGNLSGTLVGCLRSRVASALFSPPEGGGATLVIPISLDHQ